jgi:hypothetical protein
MGILYYIKTKIMSKFIHLESIPKERVLVFEKNNIEKVIDTDKILKELKEQERYIESIRDRMERVRSTDNRNLILERAKLIGMMDIAKLCNIDVSEFSWIYNI